MKAAPANDRGRPPRAAASLRLPMPSWAGLVRRLKARRLRSADISAFLNIGVWRHVTVPLMVSPASCGFASPADDYLDRPLDFNELLIVHEAATFAVRIAGESMTGVGLFPGDIAVVDRALTPVDGSIILALLGSEFTIKRYRRQGARLWLQAENPAYADIALGEDSAFEVWGVIAKSIRML